MKHSVLVPLLAGFGFLCFQPAFSQVCFTGQTFSSSTVSPYKIISSDFNNDGLPDLAYTNYYGRSIDVRMNVNGSFPSKITYTMVEAPLFIVSTDFNKDGFMDLAFNVTIANITDFIQLYYGDGTGQFSDAGRINVDYNQPVIATGDFNGDHYPDLVANAGYALKFFLNDGKGGFPLLSYSIPNIWQCGSIRCVDINNDGKDDLVTSKFNGNEVSVYFSASNSAPVLMDTLKTRNYPLDAMPLDLTGDGILDLVVAHSFGVSLYSGNGQGQYTFQNDIVAGSINELAQADLDGDNRSEILYISYNQNKFSNFYSKTVGTYSVATNKFTTGKNPYSLVSADFNGDGRPDVASANLNSDDITVFINQTMHVKAPEKLCSGSGALLTASQSDFYLWSPSLLTTPVININPVQTTTYTVTGAVGNCTTMATVVVNVDACLGVSEFNDHNALSIFPNPCTNNITLKTMSPCRATVCNYLGQELFSVSINEQQTEINLENLSSGVYFLNLDSGQRKSFVVNR